MTRTGIKRIASILCLALAAAASPAAAAAPGTPVDLAVEGQARLPVVVGPEADDQTRQAAAELARYLGRISGGDFAVETGTGRAGIVVGVPADFSELPFDADLFGHGSFARDHYLLRSHDGALYLLGATPLATRFAAWDLLFRFGHRQFFPTETWEIVPARETLRIAINEHQAPDYYSRRGPRGASRMDMRPWAQQAWTDWQIRNRATPNFQLHTSHVYGKVISANRAAFDANPDYWGLVDGQRTPRAQPNVSHPEVQQIFIDYALDTLRRNPDRDSVAMDPRDGNPWSECEPSRAIGRPTEQAVFIANLVAAAIVEEFGPDKYVGMYAYSHHSPPPRIGVHPNIIISLATSFIRGGITFDDMLAGWGERANMLGIREYYALTIWEWSLPGHGANAADTGYIRDSIARFHRHGARFMNAESNNTWGGYGLGYYLASRFLWDVAETGRYDELVDDFLTRAFGPAREPMRAFYELIDGGARDPLVPDRPRPLNDDFVGRMYRLLDQARRLAGDDRAVMTRLDDLVLYTRYVELYRRFRATSGPERQGALDEMVSFAWRIRERMMVDALGLVRSLPRVIARDDNLTAGEGWGRSRPADHHREKEDEPFTDDDIRAFLVAGIAGHQLLDIDFTLWRDSGRLAPAGFAPATRGRPLDRTHRGNLRARLAVDDGPPPRFTISAGHTRTDRGPVRWALRDGDGKTLDSGEVPPDREPHPVEPRVPGPGIYHFTISNTHQGYRWSYEPRGGRLTILAGPGEAIGRNYYDRLYFYVPRGTGRIVIAGGFQAGRHAFRDGDDNALDASLVTTGQGFTRVTVPAGQDGRVWNLTMSVIRPTWRFLNIPGYVAFCPGELLLPAEVVAALDAGRPD